MDAIENLENLVRQSRLEINFHASPKINLLKKPRNTKECRLFLGPCIRLEQFVLSVFCVAFRLAEHVRKDTEKSLNHPTMYSSKQ